MIPFRFHGTRSCAAAVLAFFAAAFPADMSLSGMVLGMDGRLLPGVTVKLARAGLSTKTDLYGSWHLNSTTGIDRRRALAVGSGHLLVDGGHLSVRFEGCDLLGRGQGARAEVTEPMAQSARNAEAQDTLLYSWNGKVRLRDTVSVSQSGIERILDTTFNASIIYGYLADTRDGQKYRSVSIGGQTWMAQNLNYQVDSSWWYEDNADNGAMYGRLYYWVAALGLDDSCYTKSCADQVTFKHQGACPTGWHVPSAGEWKRLTDTTLVSEMAGVLLKANSGFWDLADRGIDSYGFRVLPAGGCSIVSANDYQGAVMSSIGMGYDAYFWSASESLASSAWSRSFYSGDVVVSRVYDKVAALSLRCLQD